MGATAARPTRGHTSTTGGSRSCPPLPGTCRLHLRSTSEAPPKLLRHTFDAGNRLVLSPALSEAEGKVEGLTNVDDQEYTWDNNGNLTGDGTRTAIRHPVFSATSQAAPFYDPHASTNALGITHDFQVCFSGRFRTAESENPVLFCPGQVRRVETVFHFFLRAPRLGGEIWVITRIRRLVQRL